jgi:hypothetical protein
MALSRTGPKYPHLEDGGSFVSTCGRRPRSSNTTTFRWWIFSFNLRASATLFQYHHLQVVVFRQHFGARRRLKLKIHHLKVVVFRQHFGARRRLNSKIHHLKVVVFRKPCSFFAFPPGFFSWRVAV